MYVQFLIGMRIQVENIKSSQGNLFYLR